MLNRHPAIALSDENYYGHYVYNRRRAFGDLSRPEARRRLIERYLATERIRRLELDQPQLARVLMEEGTSYQRFFATLLRFYAASNGKTRWGGKTPQHALIASTLCAWYPTGTLIHIVRDPRDVVASLLRMPWGSRSVVLNARLWERCVRAAEACRDLPNYLLVRYADLVHDPATELQRVCAAIGEAYMDRMLDSSKQLATDHWWFERAQQPVTRTRQESWRRQLRPHQAALVEHVAGSWLQHFGYQASGYRLAGPALVLGLGHAAYETVASRVRNLPGLWYRWFRPTELAAEERWNDRAARKAVRSGEDQ